jgi:uncharacterized protein with FMN-binding domain
MRRSTAAAVGTLTGAALIMGVRLSVTAVPLAAPPAFDAQEVGATGNPRPTPTAASRNKDRDKATDEADDDPTPTREPEQREEQDDAPAGGLRDGKFTGAAASNPYGSIQVAITVSDGQITNAAASYPTTGQSASINANAIPKLKQATVREQSAEIDAVSGATFTTESYVTSLQAALDAARG